MSSTTTKKDNNNISCLEIMTWLILTCIKLHSSSSIKRMIFQIKSNINSLAFNIATWIILIYHERTSLIVFGSLLYTRLNDMLWTLHAYVHSVWNLQAINQISTVKNLAFSKFYPSKLCQKQENSMSLKKLNRILCHGIIYFTQALEDIKWYFVKTDFTHLSFHRLEYHSFLVFHCEHYNVVMFARPSFKKEEKTLPTMTFHWHEISFHFGIGKKFIFKPQFVGLMPKIDAMKQERLYFKRVLMFSL